MLRFRGQSNRIDLLKRAAAIASVLLTSTVLAGGQAAAQCDCPCVGDPVCDGVIDVLDVVQASGLMMMCTAPIYDPVCPSPRNEVNCDGVVNIFDVAMIINVAFRGMDQATAFCDPCGPQAVRYSESAHPSSRQAGLSGGNVVVVDSKVFGKSQSACTVGVWVTNDIALRGFVLPLEFRSGTPASYPIETGFTFTAPSSRRVPASPLNWSVTKRTLGASGGVVCSGPISSTYQANAAFDGMSPDGFLWAGVSYCNPPNLDYLPPGTDSTAGVFQDWPSAGETTPYPAGPSFLYVFQTSGVDGYFEVDTCCVTPGNHLGGSDASYAWVSFDFVKGVIQVGNPVDRTLVTSLGSTGTGTLRDAVDFANSNPGRDSIRFALAGTIRPAAPLPYLSDATGGTVIDGFSAPGASPGNPTVILDGSLAGSGSGIEITSSGNVVRGLAITKFPGAGVAVSNPAAQYNTVSQNLIYDNGALGIGISGSVDVLSIDTVLLAGSDSVFYVAGIAPEKAAVELFLAERYLGVDTVQDPSGHGEGWLYLGSDTADDVTGHWAFPEVNTRAWSYVTATATDTLGNTSEFALNRRLIPDSLIYTTYSPVHLVVITPNGQDSVGMDFNTIGPAASYDEVTDWGLGPDGVPGQADDRITITNIQPGEYALKIYPDPGGSGYYFLGIRLDGTDLGEQHAKVDGFGDTTHSQFVSEPYPNPVPAPGEMAVVGYTATAPCGCPCHGDPQCDAVRCTVQDVVQIVNVAFRGADPVTDSDCPRERTDVNCDDYTTVQDVVKVVNVAFRGADPATEFCDPCAP